MHEKSLRTLDYFKILELIAAKCAFAPSKERALELRPVRDVEAAQRLLSLTREALQLVRQNPTLSIGGARDIRKSLHLARHEGVLEAQELLDVRATLIAARNLVRLLERHREEAPLLAEWVAQMPQPVGLIDAISAAISERGEILDSASPQLAAIRHELRIVHDRLLSKLQRMVADASLAPFLQEALVTQRDGRYVLPLRAEFKGRVPAIVHDQSSSGATLFIEPLAIVEQNNQYRQLQLEEEEEERRVLFRLSVLVGDHADELLRVVEGLAEVDVVFAKAAYALEIDAIQPQLHALTPPSSGKKHAQEAHQVVLRLIQARHPLLDRRTVVPIDVVLPPDVHALVITGPNTGGKTVTLKTVGLLCLMAQSGIFIPAAESSALSVFDQVFADIGDEQSIEQSLSTFSGHITNIIYILKHADSRSLVILDELGAGTDPQEGAALARAILTHLLQRNITTLVSTHHPELKAFAHATPGVINASVEFDLETLRPTYHLTIGLPGRSNALAIAQRLGLDEDILSMARQEINPQDLRVDQLLDEIHRQRDLARQARLQTEQMRQEVAKLRAELSQRLKHIEEERQNLLEEAREQALEELSQVRAEIAEMRRALLRMRQPLDEIQPLIQKASQLEKEVVREQAEAVSIPEVSQQTSLQPGMRVRLRAFRTPGVVSSVAGEEVEVLVGNLRLRTKLSDIETLNASEASAQSEEEQQVQRIAFSTEGRPTPSMELDLRGKTAEEALRLLEDYLDAAFLAGMPFVRLIHGKGSGKLRQAVQAFLAEHAHVERFELGSPAEGGEGVTVAWLKVD